MTNAVRGWLWGFKPPLNFFSIAPIVKLSNKSENLSCFLHKKFENIWIHLDDLFMFAPVRKHQHTRGKCYKQHAHRRFSLIMHDEKTRFYVCGWGEVRLGEWENASQSEKRTNTGPTSVNASRDSWNTNTVLKILRLSTFQVINDWNKELNFFFIISTRAWTNSCLQFCTC